MAGHRRLHKRFLSLIDSKHTLSQVGIGWLTSYLPVSLP